MDIRFASYILLWLRSLWSRYYLRLFGLLYMLCFFFKLLYKIYISIWLFASSLSISFGSQLLTLSPVVWPERDCADNGGWWWLSLDFWSYRSPFRPCFLLKVPVLLSLLQISFDDVLIRLFRSINGDIISVWVWSTGLIYLTLYRIWFKSIWFKSMLKFNWSFHISKFEFKPEWTKMI